MPKAAKRINVASTSTLRALKNANVPMVQINAKAYAVDENDLETFLASRPAYEGKGRPKGSTNWNKPKSEAGEQAG